MDLDCWYRKTERKATARMSLGVVVAFMRRMASTFLAKIGKEAAA